jgi:polyhydroxyalkanoate synthesis regulator phasin
MKGAFIMLGNLESDLKKVLLAGIGALATTVEKSKDIVDELVKKGEITVEQGKALNEELKHDIQKEEKESAACAADVTEKLEHLNAEDLAKIKEKLAELEEKQKNCDCES